MKYSVRFSRKDPDNFFKTLRGRVNDYFSDNKIEKTGNSKMFFKVTVILLAYFGFYGLILSGAALAGWMIIAAYIGLGLSIVEIGLCIMHDANHGSLSKNETVNKILSYTMNMLGASTFTWHIQHNVMHHTYTNIYHLDEDIDDKPFIRLSPHGKLKKYHRFQHIYAFFLYCFATLSWFVSKDFKMLYHYNKTGVTAKNGSSPTKEVIEMVLSKALYFFHILVLPILLGVSWKFVLIGYFIAQMVAGLLITLVFQLAHVVDGPHHYTAETEEPTENSWALHQLKTTANFSTKNKFVTWTVGGLNFQVEHHLFPSVCHIHYPEISKIVKQTAEEFGVDYFVNEKLSEAIGSHINQLKMFGQAEDVGALTNA